MTHRDMKMSKPPEPPLFGCFTKTELADLFDALDIGASENAGVRRAWINRCREDRELLVQLKNLVRAFGVWIK